MRWLFGHKEGTPEIVQTGICKVGKYLHLVHPEMADRGIKLVSIPSELEARFNAVRIEWNQIQFELSKYPPSLRPRRPKSPASGNQISMEESPC